MNRHFAKILSLILTVSCLVLGGVKPGSHVTKHLPLDGVPGVVLKNRSNSMVLPNYVIVKLMPQAVTSLSKTSFGIQTIDHILSGVAGINRGQMFPTSSAPQKAGDVDLSLLYAVSFSSPNDPFTLAEQLSNLPEVEYAEPWFISKVTGDRTFTPNDSLYSLQWALKQVNAPSAWDYSQGDSTVVIAIVDSGVEWTHPDLAANIWVNPGETGFDAHGNDKRSNGTDDDNNGYVDDWHGWDLVGVQWETFNPLTTKGDNDPSPTGSNNNHGTHVAGIIAAVTNNRIGVASLAPKCRILPVKCSADDDYRGGGDAYILAGYQGIVYAVKMGAKIINCSWGSDGGAQAEQDIIDYATQNGVLVVAAAGNETSEGFFSPADYRNVVSVAATDVNDKIASFSNYGDYIDVCSPGVSIWSTLYPHTYDQLSGTSMASPLTAALAALVKSKFPSYTNLQVGEQVRVTCDNIDASNSAYVGKIGSGRIDALRALTVTTLPSVRLQTYTINISPVGHSFPQPGDTLNIACSFRNFLSPTSSGATVQLTTVSPYLTILKGSMPIPSLATLDSINNKSAPFRVFIHPDVPPSQTVKLNLLFTDGSFSSTQAISVLVNPTFGTQDINAIQLTLTNNGRLGYYDFPTNNEGVGFVFNGINALYEGGLILGTSSTKLVDVVRNEIAFNTQDNDFFSNSFFTLTTPGLLSQQDGLTNFTDGSASAANLIGLGVSMHSYAYSDPVNSEYIILRYDIKNLGISPVSGLYAGIFLDWDLPDFSPDNDVSRYDPTRSLGYCFDSSKTTRAYVGIRALDSASSFRSLVNDGTLDLSRAGKWNWISGGFSQTSAGPADIHHVISSGPFTIAVGDSITVGFALVAGDSSLANIRQNADAAKVKWLLLRKSGFLVSVPDEGQLPRMFGLSPNYPNPFNPSTAISYQLSAGSFVTLKVYDMLGREVTTLISGEQQAGSYTVRWNASGFSSGVYLYRLVAGRFVETKKMVLLK